MNTRSQLHKQKSSNFPANASKNKGFRIEKSVSNTRSYRGLDYSPSDEASQKTRVNPRTQQMLKVAGIKNSVKQEVNKENKDSSDDKVKLEMDRINQQLPNIHNKDKTQNPNKQSSPTKSILVSPEKHGTTPEQISQFTDEQQQNTPPVNNILQRRTIGNKRVQFSNDTKFSKEKADLYDKLAQQIKHMPLNQQIQAKDKVVIPNIIKQEQIGQQQEPIINQSHNILSNQQQNKNTELRQNIETQQQVNDVICNVKQEQIIQNEQVLQQEENRTVSEQYSSESISNNQLILESQSLLQIEEESMSVVINRARVEIDFNDLKKRYSQNQKRFANPFKNIIDVDEKSQAQTRFNKLDINQLSKSTRSLSGRFTELDKEILGDIFINRKVSDRKEVNNYVSAFLGNDNKQVGILNLNLFLVYSRVFQNVIYHNSQYSKVTRNGKQMLIDFTGDECDCQECQRFFEQFDKFEDFRQKTSLSYRSCLTYYFGKGLSDLIINQARLKEIKSKEEYKFELKNGNLTLFSRLDDLMISKINSNQRNMIINAFKQKGISENEILNRYELLRDCFGYQ